MAEVPLTSCPAVARSADASICTATSSERRSIPRAVSDLGRAWCALAGRAGSAAENPPALPHPVRRPLHPRGRGALTRRPVSAPTAAGPAEDPVRLEAAVGDQSTESPNSSHTLSNSFSDAWSCRRNFQPTPRKVSEAVR